MVQVEKLSYGVTYIRDAFFLRLLILISIYKLLKRSKEKPYGSYIYLGVAGFIDVIFLHEML
jgi:hypothetical protein